METQKPIHAVSNIVEFAILEMQENEILWNTKKPDYYYKNRKQIIKDIAARGGIPADKFKEVIHYVKRRFNMEHEKITKSKSEGKLENSTWKWYNKCSFLKDAKPVANLKYFSNKEKPIGLQIKTAEATSTTTLRTYLRADSKKPSSKVQGGQTTPETSNQSDPSTNNIFIVDPDEQIQCKLESESEDSLQHQTDDAMDIPPDSGSDGEPEDPIAVKSPPKKRASELSKARRQFIIDAVCSSVSFQLSNEELTEKDLVSFHSDLVKYMYTYFSKRKK
ncbi:uncharacterized protein LOC129802107 [Phlebotomus papatasi]|uniref:uncharacterized protein LOC129802107 n=1 Tax=Phlebotomus papatasi TaxID=29031 RepID=UPI002483B7D3|nr:uncharacterized protein LOC129802107 [Phlebotomus papatasi]